MQSKLIFGVITFSIGMATLPSAKAADNFDLNYYTITQVETHEVPTSNSDDYGYGVKKTPAPSSAPNANSGPQIGDILGKLGSLGGVSIADIVNLGRQIWQVIEENKPVVNVTLESANALPKGVTAWQDLAGWKAPQARTFETTFTNAFGMNVVNFQYRLTFTPGGSYRGLGEYLTNVSVEPSDLYVAWGYKFSAQASVPNITNAGTMRAPMAAAEVLVKWTVDTVVNHAEQSASYYVRGDGTFQSL